MSANALRAATVAQEDDSDMSPAVTEISEALAAQSKNFQVLAQSNAALC